MLLRQEDNHFSPMSSRLTQKKSQSLYTMSFHFLLDPSKGGQSKQMELLLLSCGQTASCCRTGGKRCVDWGALGSMLWTP